MPERASKIITLGSGRKVKVWESIRLLALARQGVNATETVTVAMNPEDHSESEVVAANDQLSRAILAQPLDLEDLEDAEWTALTKVVGETLFPATDATFPEDGGAATGSDGSEVQPAAKPAPRPRKRKPSGVPA
jgi:hypothetical protein